MIGVCGASVEFIRAAGVEACDVSITGNVTACPDVAGVIGNITWSRVLTGVDFYDGSAGVVEALDTLVIQRVGDNRIFVGYNAFIGALVRAVTDVLGDHPGRSTHGDAVIIGSSPAAASALAALVQLGYESIAVTHPGPVLHIAHRMNIPVRLIHHDADISAAALVMAGATTGPATSIHTHALIDLTGTWNGEQPDIHVAMRDILIYQRQDQIRAITGKQPEWEAIRTALDN